MIDFHSHVLPGIDDGAENSKMSIQMLETALKSGVTTVVATSHCYVTEEDSVEKFLSKRENSYARLMSAVKSRDAVIPNIILGAEVHISPNISRNPLLDKLCISNTNYILLEMPYEPWKDWMFEEVYEIARLGYRPIMAHIDRFISQEKYFPNLFSVEDALFQINASAFMDKKLRRKVLKLFSEDAAHVIGSDMHNNTTRPPNLAEAYGIIDSKFGWEYVDFLQNNSIRIVDNKETLPTALPRLNIFKRIFM